MPPKHRPALSLDDAKIDFSTVDTKHGQGGKDHTGAGTSGGSSGSGPVPLDLFLPDSSSNSTHPRGGQESLQRAYDPALAAYIQRKAGGAAVATPLAAGGAAPLIAGRRRGAVFGGGPSRQLLAVQEQQQQQVQRQEERKWQQQQTQEPRQTDAPSSSSSKATAADTTNTTASVAATPAPIDFAALRQQQASAASSFLLGVTAHLNETLSAAPATGDAVSKAKELADRKEAYLHSLRQLCQQGLPWAAAASEEKENTTVSPSPVFPCDMRTGQSNSLLCSLFVDGVPDVEPWDRWAFQLPRYDPAALVIKPSKQAAPPASTIAALPGVRDTCDLVHHPLLPASDYTLRYQHAAAQHPVEATLYKTKDELKAERRERLKRKQEEKRKAAAQAAKEGNLTMTEADDGSGGLFVNKTTALAHDRLSNRNLVHNMLGSSILNPIAAESKVLDQYQQRFLEHQMRNHDRHVAALPRQIAKRDRRAERHATEHPVLRAYRIFPIYGQAHLGKLRNFANDHRLRGFVLWVGACDAVVVLAGGEVAMRHLDHWILRKLLWESADTVATRLCSVPLQDPTSFSFHLKRLGRMAETGKGRKRGRASESEDDHPNTEDGSGEGKEPVFMNQCATVEEAEAFLRELPVESPWANLAAVWRAAFLADGLGNQGVM